MPQPLSNQATAPEPITAIATVRRDREAPIRRRHPWLFSGGIEKISGTPADGDLIAIQSQAGETLALGYYNSRSQIRARLLTWTAEPIDGSFWAGRLAAAIERRRLLDLVAVTDACRLVNAEADGLPGLIVDRYGDWLVLQALTLGIDRRKHALAQQLAALLRPRGIIERSDAAVRQKEGLPSAEGILYGDAPPAPLLIHEHGLTYEVDLPGGHKTGFYLDQRDNRALLTEARYVQGRDVLNMFSYTGGFGLAALKGGARSVINSDSSVEALEAAERNLAHNGFELARSEQLAADAFELLRGFRDEGRQFDVIVLDPPKFVHSQRDIERAARGYKDLNWLALRLLRPNGLLLTFSCSGLVSADLFQKIVFGALVDAGRDAQIIHTLTQAPDHPVSLTVPESAYLKGLLCRVF